VRPSGAPVENDSIDRDGMRLSEGLRVADGQHDGDRRLTGRFQTEITRLIVKSPPAGSDYP
jgi:hypothetical protein